MALVDERFWKYRPERQHPEQSLSPEALYRKLADEAVRRYDAIYQQVVLAEPKVLPITPEETLPYADGFFDTAARLLPRIFAAKDPTILERLEGTIDPANFLLAKEEPFLFAILTESAQASLFPHPPSRELTKSLRRDPTGVSWLRLEANRAAQDKWLPPAHIAGMHAAIEQVQQFSHPQPPAPRRT